MIKNENVWCAKAQLLLGLFGDQGVQVDLPDIYIVAPSYEAVFNLVQNAIRIEDEKVQSNIHSIEALSRQVFLPADLLSSIEGDNVEVSVNGNTPAKLFKVSVRSPQDGNTSELYVVHDTAQLSGTLVMDSSQDIDVIGISLLANRVFMDANSYPTAQEKSKDAQGSPNSCYKLLSKEQQSMKILENQTLWASLLKGYGGPMWGGRYTKALLAAGIKTVSDMVLYIMALGLESVPGQSYGSMFKFAKKTPDGKVITVNPSDVGHYGWKGILDNLKQLEFDWEKYIVNLEDFNYFEATTSDPFLPNKKTKKRDL